MSYGAPASARTFGFELRGLGSLATGRVQGRLPFPRNFEKQSQCAAHIETCREIAGLQRKESGTLAMAMYFCVAIFEGGGHHLLFGCWVILRDGIYPLPKLHTRAPQPNVPVVSVPMWRCGASSRPRVLDWRVGTALGASASAPAVATDRGGSSGGDGGSGGGGGGNNGSESGEGPRGLRVQRARRYLSGSGCQNGS